LLADRVDDDVELLVARFAGWAGLEVERARAASIARGERSKPIASAPAARAIWRAWMPTPPRPMTPTRAHDARDDLVSRDVRKRQLVAERHLPQPRLHVAEADPSCQHLEEGRPRYELRLGQPDLLQRCLVGRIRHR